MKKVFLTIVPAMALVAMSLSSCSSDCCTLLTAKVCEDDFDSSQGTWAEYKDILSASGYSCD